MAAMSKKEKRWSERSPSTTSKRIGSRRKSLCSRTHSYRLAMGLSQTRLKTFRRIASPRQSTKVALDNFQISSRRTKTTSISTLIRFRIQTRIPLRVRTWNSKNQGQPVESVTEPSRKSSNQALMPTFRIRASLRIDPVKNLKDRPFLKVATFQEGTTFSKIRWESLIKCRDQSSTSTSSTSPWNTNITILACRQGTNRAESVDLATSQINQTTLVMICTLCL